MQKMNKFEILSTRESFNAVVRHIKSAMVMAEGLSGKANLADLVLEAASTQDMSGEQISAFLGMLLVDKLGYTAVSKNLDAICENMSTVAQEVVKWQALDLVFAYHHPDVGLVVANPKNTEQMNAINSLRKRELLVIYAGYSDKPADKLCSFAAKALISLVEGEKPKIDESLYSGSYKFKPVSKKESEGAIKGGKRDGSSKGSPKKSAGKGKAKGTVAPTASAKVSVVQAPPPAVPATSAKRRMTPMNSVVVQNELFHNGNVEAWKRIIASYRNKYPDLEVYIYYDGERIIDINSLFKWGKVKHGSCIQFAIAGSDIKDVAKLQRYLSQGASHMFEAFLHGPVSTVLKLF